MEKYLQIIFLFLSCHQFIFFCAGRRYDVILNRIETSEETGSYIKFDDLNIAKQEGDGNTFRFGGKIELLKEVDNSKEVSIELSKLSDDKYIKIFQFPKENVCNFMTSLYRIYIYQTVSKCSNLPNPDDCPIASGQYEINDCSADVGDFDQFGESLGVGNFSTTLTLLDKDEVLGFFTIYSSIIKNPETA